MSIEDIQAEKIIEKRRKKGSNAKIWHLIECRKHAQTEFKKFFTLLVFTLCWFYSFSDKYLLSIFCRVVTWVFFFSFFKMEFDLPTYSITPSAHPIQCSPQSLSPSHPTPLPTLLSTTPCFPELGVSHVLLPSLIFPTHFLSFLFFALHYFLYLPNKWDRIMFVLL